jgi:NDP-sugar pyrophosphorylase family protein
VELSVVEEGAEIGPHAVVKNSYVARGARIDDGALVNACVIGEGAFVGSASAVFSSVLYPGAFAAQHKMQFSVLGESSVAFTGSYFYDTNFERNVHVAHRGRVVDSGGRFMSVCLGPWARIAGGVWIASGREVPAHALVVQPPDRVLHRVDAELAASRMTTVKDRALVDVGPLPAKADDPKQLG